MTHAENFALNEWLSDYPSFMTYDEIIEMMIGDADEWTHESITAWQTVEHFTLHQVAEFIEDTRAHFEHTVNAMKAEGAL